MLKLNLIELESFLGYLFKTFSFCSYKLVLFSFLLLLAQIEKLRGSVVTQKLATRFKDPIGNCWKDLGPYLELPESELHNIDTDYVQAREKGGAVLQSWRDKKGCKATVGHLVSVLHKIGMKRIADELLGT